MPPETHSTHSPTPGARRDPGTLADRLRRARLLAGLEQAQLAALIGVARTSVSNYERGRTEPPASTFVHWAQATGTSLDWIARGVPQVAAGSPDALSDPIDLSA